MYTTYDILHDYMENISDCFHIRVYSDDTINVSGRIGKEHISLEGSSNLVICCVKQLYWETINNRG